MNIRSVERVVGARPVAGDSREARSDTSCVTLAVPPRGDVHPRHERYVMIGMISSATMLATLIIGLIAGPAVSL